MSNIKIIGTPLFQWEVGRKVQIVPVRNMRVDAVHFSNFGDTEALVVKPKEENGMIVADIPNILLQSGSNIVVYSVNISQDSVETILDCTFSVRNRAKPADYVYTETEVLTWESLDRRITILERGGGGGDGGFSPIVEVKEIEGGHRVTIIDADGEHTFDVMDGKDGQPGKDGAPGADGKDGSPGKDGADGYTPQKGVDYWTPADIAEIKGYVDEAILGGAW